MSDFQTVNKKGNPVPTSVKKYAEQQQKLVEMGFELESVIRALELAQGDIASATMILLDDDNSSKPSSAPTKSEEKPDSTRNSQSAGRNATSGSKDIKENHHRMMATYKIQKCKEAPGHDRKMCIFWHSLSDRRRNPFEYNYSCYECPNTAAGNECKDGDACPHAHTMLERMFHPELYKISMCQRIHTSQKCDRGLLCAFAHSEADLRASPTTAKLVDPVDGKPIKRQAPNTPAFNAILEKLVRIIREAGPEGVIAADLPKKYIVQYTESLDLVDEKGEKYRVRDLLVAHPAVEVVLQKGAQPKYVYNDSKDSTPSGGDNTVESTATAAAVAEQPVAPLATTKPVATAVPETTTTSSNSSTNSSNNNTKAEASTNSSVKQRLVQVIKAAGKEGVLGSDLPKKYLEMFGEKLDVTDESGAKIRLKDMISPNTGVVVQMLKLQPKYVYDPALATAETAAATPSTASTPNTAASSTTSTTASTPNTTSTSKTISYSSIASGGVVAGKSYSAVAAALRAPAAAVAAPAPAAVPAPPTASEPASKPTPPAVPVATPAPVPTPAATEVALEDTDAPSSEDPVFTETEADPVDQLIGGDDSDDSGLIGGEEIVAEITSYSDSAFEYTVPKDTTTARLIDDFARKSEIPLMMAAPGLTKIARPPASSSDNTAAQSLSNLIASSMHLGNNTATTTAPGASTIADFSERLTVAQNQCNQLQLQITKLQNELAVKSTEYEGQSLQLRNMMQRLAEAESKSSNDEHYKHQLKSKDEELAQKGRELTSKDEEGRKIRDERILDLNQFYLILSQVEDAINGMKCKEETFSEKIHPEDVQELLQFRKALKQYVLTIKGQLKQKFDLISTTTAATTTTTTTKPTTEATVPVTTNTASAAATSRYVNTNNNGAYEQAYYGSNAYGATATHGACAFPGCRAEGIYTCAGCQKVSYCGAEHQRLHWGHHSSQCNP